MIDSNFVIAVFVRGLGQIVCQGAMSIFLDLKDNLNTPQRSYRPFRDGNVRERAFIAATSIPGLQALNGFDFLQRMKG
jgi:hypothetical protein